VSTAADYWKFLQMLENGGELNGVRIVSPTTIDLDDPEPHSWKQRHFRLG
jgi:hypothetical protein